MPCGVTSCSISDDRFLWRCEYCSKKYHAACIGVQRHREHIITAFMVPMCADCQDILRKEADVRKLLHQQEQLLEAIRSQTDVNQRVAADIKKIYSMSELFDSIELLLNDLKETVNNNNGQITSTVSQHVKSCDSRMHSIINECNLVMSQKIAELLDKRLTNVHKDILRLTEKTENLSILNNDQALSKNSADSLQEILEEIKFVSATISTSKITENQCPQTSLEEELAESLDNNQVSEQLHQNHQQKQHQQQLRQTTNRPEKQQHLKKSNPPHLENGNNAIAALFAERRAKFSNSNAAAQLKINTSRSGWRTLGNKRCWRQDWSAYDLKQTNLQLQEKAAEKARQRRKRRKEQISRVSYKQTVDSRAKPKLQERNQGLVLDKELLAIAKAKFSSPPSTTDHPISGLSVPKKINFRKGETINPYRAEKQSQHSHNTAFGNEAATPPLPSINQQPQQPSNQHQIIQPTCNNTLNGANANQHDHHQQQQQQQHQLPNPDSQFELDPMRPPIVRLTQQSTEGDGRFLKARLRDPNIMKIVRLYLAYMKDQSANICIDGNTPTSIKMVLASEGLPTDPDHLLRIFADVHQEYGVGPAEAAADLEAYRRYLSSERTNRLQQLRENSHKFFSPPPGPSNFRK